LPKRADIFKFHDKVRVVLPSGQVMEGAEHDDPESLEAYLGRFQALSDEMAATANRVQEVATEIASAREAMDETLNRFSHLALEQAELNRVIRDLTKTLRMPVKPVYDGHGRLMGAERVMKLELK